MNLVNSVSLGTLTNLAVCSSILVLSMIYYAGIRKRVNQEKTLASASNAPDCDRFDFIQAASFWWTFGALCWAALYGGLTCGLIETKHTLLLANLNSISLLLMYYFVTRGTSATRADSWRVCLILVATMLGVDLLMYGAGLLAAPNSPTIFQQYWSVALAVFAPFALGRGFRLRYGTNSVWVICSFYALLQPIAYGTSLLPDDGIHRQLTITLTHTAYNSLSQDTQFVLHTDTEATGEAVEYYINMASRPENGFLDKRPRIVQELSSAASESGAGTLEVALTRAQLLASSLTFNLLALLKVLLAANILAVMQFVPFVADPVVFSLPRVSQPEKLLDWWKTLYWGGFLLAACVAWIVVARHSHDPLILITYGILGSSLVAALRITKQNRSMTALIGNADKRRAWNSRDDRPQ